ncbi:MAG: patatin-like phospholipase family protein [Sulfurovum sp.]|jgi:NTE family protein
MTVSLCLSGGGARGAFELGVLQYLDENNVTINNISASSIGSIIACSYGSGVKPKEILEIFKKQELQSAIKFKLRNIFSGGMFSIDLDTPIINELFPIKNLENIPKNIYICIYDMKSKKIEYINKGNVKDVCLCSVSLIPVFKAIKIKGKTLIDGGLKDNLPITPLLKFEDKILSVDLFPKKSEYKHKKFNFNPIKTLQRYIFNDMIINQKISIEKSDYYLTNEKLRNKKVLSFKDLDENFHLGYETVSDYFKPL